MLYHWRGISLIGRSMRMGSMRIASLCGYTS